MRRIAKVMLVLAVTIALMFTAVIPVAALNDTYRFDEFGMSVKVPKGYHVIKRDTPADDPIFSYLQQNYQDTMNEFQSANVYLCAYDPDWTFQMRMKIIRNENSEKISNYADLSEAGLKEHLDTLLASDPLANKVKRGDYIFFETSLEDNTGEEPIYIQKSETIVNGYQVELTLRKSADPISTADAKALIALASSIEFDAVKDTSSGLTFDWWRLLLWVFILVALTVILSLLARHRNTVRHRRIEEHRRKREEAESAAVTVTADTVTVGEQEITFDEALGYGDSDRFSSRAGADLESIDINVREKDPDRGVNFFEDGGKSIDDRSEDYFDSYFKEPTPARSGISRLFSTVGAYIGIGLRHVGYFFRNLWRSIRRKKKK